MSFIKAFIASGLLCAFVQLVMEKFKIDFLKLFMMVITAGVLVTTAGWMDHLVKFGQGGVMISILDAGEGLFWSFYNLVRGNAEIIVRYTVMILLVLTIGLVSGFLKAKRNQ